MTIIVYDDVIFPSGLILAGATGTLSRKNARSSNQGGFEDIGVINDRTKRSYMVGTMPVRVSDAEAVVGIYEVTDAGAYGMLFEDPIDSTIAAANGALMGYMAGVESGVVGFGNGGPLYGLRKVYIAQGSTRSRARPVTRPKGVPSLLRAGAPVTIGAAAGNASISAGPSYVTFVADASRSVSSVTVGATTQITLASALPGVAIGGKLWIDTLSGADAALLNNLSHTVTNISGGGLNVYTLSTNTAGKTITAGSGQGRKYPQPTEALAWSGNYYVPVHFRDDDINWDVANQGPIGARLLTLPDIYLDEVIEA